MTIQPPIIIQPGIQRFAETGNMVIFDTSQGIKSLIEKGFFNGAILDKIGENKDKFRGENIKFAVQVPRSTIRTIISYDTPFVKEGIKIQNCLLEEVTKNYTVF